MLIDPTDLSAPRVEGGFLAPFYPPTVRAQHPDRARSFVGVTYAVALGYRNLQLDLHVPLSATAETPVPVVVWIHGGAWMFGSRELLPAEWGLGSVAQLLVDAGIAVALIDYRHARVHFALPPLRARVEDVPLLVEHFLRLEEQNGKPRRRASKRMLAALARRNWPGNVRELRNEVARLCILSEGDLDDPTLVSRPATFGLGDLSVKEIVPISELERRAIHAALEKTNGDKRKAAEMLGISRAKIYQRLKDWQEGRD